jgi:hypothetical protein
MLHNRLLTDISRGSVKAKIAGELKNRPGNGRHAHISQSKRLDLFYPKSRFFMDSPKNGLYNELVPKPG